MCQAAPLVSRVLSEIPHLLLAVQGEQLLAHPSLSAEGFAEVGSARGEQGG